MKFTAGQRTVTSHSKNDAFGRKVFDELQFETGFASRQFSYHVGKVTETHAEGEKLKSAPTTQLVERIILSDGRILSYEYDAEERITKVTDSVEGVTEYTYDALGQLLTESHNGEVVNEMTYDNYGNILTKNGENYTYGDVAWRDRLTAVDGKLITYDAQGNPTNYFGYELSWEKGRQLKSFEQNTYTYNANGIRTSKTVNGVTHTYTLDGTNILRETWGDNELLPMYDNEDNVCGIIYNESPFYFLKNLQGDVNALVDKSGKVVARYSYDAWGVCTIETDTSGSNIAKINPYRYRGYYYDTEIGMYYLQSRYYDPSVGRFVNGDDAEYIGRKDCLAHENLYCYCRNNPIKYVDYSGNLSLEIAGFIVLMGLVAMAFVVALQPWLRQMANTITDLITYVGSTIKQSVRAVCQALNYAISKAKTRARTRSTAKHHIIAQSAWRASSARYIWTNYKRCNLSINDSRNLVNINRNLHLYMHTISYYTSVNAMVEIAYARKKKAGVLKAVASLKSILATISYNL